MVEFTREAASSTVPAAVTQEWGALGERKKTRAGSELWLSAMSTNQVSQAPHCSWSCSSPWMR
ncbi:MAG TPA: hypothetical protein VF823_10625 [Anaerolineales bacterium]